EGEHSWGVDVHERPPGSSVGRVLEPDEQALTGMRQISHAAPENRSPPVSMPGIGESIVEWKKNGRLFNRFDGEGEWISYHGSGPRECGAAIVLLAFNAELAFPLDRQLVLLADEIDRLLQVGDLDVDFLPAAKDEHIGHEEHAIDGHRQSPAAGQ